MDIFLQSLELGKQGHPFWDFNVRDVGAYVLLPGRPFIQMLTFFGAFVTNRFQLQRKNTLARDMQKMLLCPLFPPILRLGWIDSQNISRSETLALHEFALKKTVSHIGHALEFVIVMTYSFSPRVPPSQWASTSCTTLTVCGFQRIRCISHPPSSNICTGTFCAFLSRETFVFLGCSWEGRVRARGWRGGGSGEGGREK